jgi:hypothetical protein
VQSVTILPSTITVAHVREQMPFPGSFHRHESIVTISVRFPETVLERLRTAAKLEERALNTVIVRSARAYLAGVVDGPSYENNIDDKLEKAGVYRTGAASAQERGDQLVGRRRRKP